MHMVEPISATIAAWASAPKWAPVLKQAFADKAAETGIGKIQSRVGAEFDERKHQRNIELALKNAAERSFIRFDSPEEREQFRDVLNLLSERHGDELRRQAIRVFTLSDNPDVASLSKIYNRSRRMIALAEHIDYIDIDAAPYLDAFFEALLSELYLDPLFRDRVSDVLQAKAAAIIPPRLEEIVSLLSQIHDSVSSGYTADEFWEDLTSYLNSGRADFSPPPICRNSAWPASRSRPGTDGVFIPLRIKLENSYSGDGVQDDQIAPLLQHFSYMVLLGAPGSGKSTTTRFMAWVHAKVHVDSGSISDMEKSNLLSGQPVPLRIELRLLSEARKRRPYSFGSYATEVLLGQANCSVNPQMFDQLLVRRQMFVLFDGLDEVPTLDERRRLIDEIEQFALNFPGNRILVTSRPVGYDIARFADRWFRHGVIQNLDDSQIQLFVDNWYLHVLKLVSLSAEQQQELDEFVSIITSDARLRKLAVNPLLLSVMTATHQSKRLPDKRVQLYDECSDLLLETWAKLKHGGLRWKDLKLSKDDQHKCLAHLGFVLHEKAQESPRPDAADSPGVDELGRCNGCRPTGKVHEARNRGVPRQGGAVPIESGK